MVNNKKVGSMLSFITPQFKLDLLLEFYKAIGMKDVTTDRQRKNGTIQFQDLTIHTNRVYYTFHKSGYFRRKIVSNHVGYMCYHFRSTEHYQLNRTKREL